MQLLVVEFKSFDMVLIGVDRIFQYLRTRTDITAYVDISMHAVMHATIPIREIEISSTLCAFLPLFLKLCLRHKMHLKQKY
jgi:hypothetical protein